MIRGKGLMVSMDNILLSSVESVCAFPPSDVPQYFSPSHPVAV